MSVQDDLQEPLLERLSSSPEPNESEENQTTSSKRKRDTEEVEQSSKKTAKKRKSKKSKVAGDDELDTELGINNAFAHMDSQLLADYVAQRTRQYESDLSSVELEDKYIPGIYMSLWFQGILIYLISSDCNPGYHIMGQPQDFEQLAWLPREICRQFNKAMGSV